MSAFSSPIPPKIDKAQEIVEKMKVIEEEYNGFSNIPMNHESYWALRKELARLKK